MKYGKLVDGALEKAPSYLKVGTSYVFNPSARQYADAGWLPVDDAWPAAPEGKVVASWTWALADGAISRKCEYRDAPAPERLDVSTLSGLKSAAEKFAAALGFATCLALACRAAPVEKEALKNLAIDGAEVVVDVDASAFLSTNYMDDVAAALAAKADASNSVQYVADRNGDPTAVTIGHRLTNLLVGASSFAVGTDTAASGRRSVAIGGGARATNDNSFVWHNGFLFYYSHGNGTFNLNPSGGLGGLYIGSTSLKDTLAGLLPVSYTNQPNVAFGQGAVAGESISGNYSVAIGSGARAPNSSVAVGAGAEANGKFYSTALGYGAKASASSSTALGYGAQASASSTVALGYNTEATGLSSTALGTYTKASGDGSIALGTLAQATHANSVVINATGAGYGSQGAGTVTLAVNNGLADVYVGATSLADAVSDAVKDAVKDAVPVLDKVRVGGVLYNVSVSGGALALTPAEEGEGSE